MGISRLVRETNEKRKRLNTVREPSCAALRPRPPAGQGRQKRAALNESVLRADDQLILVKTTP
jgi:hypothetical protein